MSHHGDVVVPHLFEVLGELVVQILGGDWKQQQGRRALFADVVKKPSGSAARRRTVRGLIVAFFLVG